MTGPRRAPIGTQLSETAASFGRRPGHVPVAPASAYGQMLVEVAGDTYGAHVQILTHPIDTAADCATTAVDMEREVLREAFVDPFTNIPDERAAWPGHVVSSVLGMIGAVEQVQYAGIAALTAPFAAMMAPLPAMTLSSMGIGIPHAHVHPPSTTPPAPPCPMPSFGTMLLPGALNVLLGGIPAARAGDVGIIATCVSFGIPVEVIVGSSNTFFGGARAGRIGTDLFFHDNPAPVSPFAAVMLGAGMLAGALNAAGQVAEGNFAAGGMSAAQAAADAAAVALTQLRKIDPGLPPDLGTFLTGDFTVLVGGFPLPPAMDISQIVGALRGLASRIARRLRASSDDGRPGRTGHVDDEASGVGRTSCPKP